MNLWSRSGTGSSFISIRMPFNKRKSAPIAKHHVDLKERTSIYLKTTLSWKHESTQLSPNFLLLKLTFLPLICPPLFVLIFPFKVERSLRDSFLYHHRSGRSLNFIHLQYDNFIDFYNNCLNIKFSGNFWLSNEGVLYNIDHMYTYQKQSCSNGIRLFLLF